MAKEVHAFDTADENCQWQTLNANDVGAAASPHELAGAEHNADNFANLDGKVNDADLVKTALNETSIVNEVPRFTDTNANDIEGSGVLVETGIAGGSLINLVAYATDPVSPDNGDLWILNSGGIWLKFRSGGVTYAIQLS